MGSFWEAFWLHFSVFLAPGSLLDASWHEKHGFSGNSIKTNRKSIKMPPGHTPKRPKIDPSRSQEGTFSLRRPAITPRSLQDRPQTGPRASKTAQGFPRIPPRAPQDPSRSPQERPRPSQEHSRPPQDRPRTSPRAPEDPPKPPQDNPRTP